MPTLRSTALGPAAPRVRLRVAAPLRGPLASALLSRGLQPVLDGGDAAPPAALEIRTLGVEALAQAAEGVGRAETPLLALLPPAGARGAGDLRQHALHAGAVSLLTLDGSPGDIDTTARIAVRLIRHLLASHPPASLETGGPKGQTSPAASPGSGPTGAVAAPAPPRHPSVQPPELAAALDDAIALAGRRGDIGALLRLGLNRLAEVDAALGSGARKAVVDATEIRLTHVLRSQAQRHRRRAAPELHRHGEGYSVVLSQLTHAEQAREMAMALLEAAAQPMRVAGVDTCVSANVGIALLPHDGLDVGALVEASKRALHHATALGPGLSRFHEPELATRGRERLRLEARLRHAIAEGRLELHYQPLVDLGSGTLTGIEALLRWPDPVAGPVEPSVFVPLAEAAGLIVPLGQWVLQSVCLQIRQWLERGLEVPRVHVNVSPVQLRQQDFSASVLKALADHGLPGHHLGIELTEAALDSARPAGSDDDPSGLRSRLQALRDAQIQLAIDDFGTGQSSIAALRRLPLDRLKIDRSFVADLGQDGGLICAAIVDLGHALGLRVVAEGIETEEQLAWLRERGCDEFQGHVLAPALEAALMGEVLAGATVQHRVHPAPAPLPVGSARHLPSGASPGAAHGTGKALTSLPSLPTIPALPTAPGRPSRLPTLPPPAHTGHDALTELSTLF